MREVPPASSNTSESALPVHSYDSLGSFLTVERILDGRHAIEHGHDVTTDLLVLDRQATTTVITFNGAAAPRAARPYFQATGMLSSLEDQVGPINRVHVHDGLLAHHEDLRIGWYLGTPEVNLSAQLTRILEKVLQQLRRGPVVIFGSSAGGFAALTQGEALPDTIVVAANPQTVLERYEPNLYRAWLEIGGWIPSEDPFPSPSRITARTDLRKNPGPYRPRHTYLLLNINDKLHVGSHALPWMEENAGGRAISVVAGSKWGPNHAPAPRQLLEPFLKRVIDSADGQGPVTHGGSLGQMIPNASLGEVRSTFLPYKLESESLNAEIDIRNDGVRFSVRDPKPGKAVTVSAGLRAKGRPIFHTHLLSMELRKNGEEYRGPMQGTVWSSHPLIGHFVYLPLRDGHSRFMKTFTPPSDVSIVGVRFCQWVKGTDAHVFLTDVLIMGTEPTGEALEVELRKDGQSS